MGGCSNKHYIYPCGVEVQSCRIEIEKKDITPQEEQDEQERVMKHKMLESMNMILDQLLQNLLRGI